MASNHTAAQKQAAVEHARNLILNDGLTANAAARVAADHISTSPRSVQRWAQNAGTPLGNLSHDTAKNARAVQAIRNEANREALKDELFTKARDLLARMDEPHIDFKGKDAGEVTYPKAPADAVRNYATSVGILIDKLRLEEGKATSRVAGLPAMSDVEAMIAEAEAAAKGTTT